MNVLLILLVFWQNLQIILTGSAFNVIDEKGGNAVIDELTDEGIGLGIPCKSSIDMEHGCPPVFLKVITDLR